jgi:hypothetical protein
MGPNGTAILTESNPCLSWNGYFLPCSDDPAADPILGQINIFHNLMLSPVLTWGYQVRLFPSGLQTDGKIIFALTGHERPDRE